MAEDLTTDLAASATWFELKMILSRAILSMPEDTAEGRAKKYELVKFMAHEWPGHAPRSCEMATMTSILTRVQRERDKLRVLIDIPQISKRRSKT